MPPTVALLGLGRRRWLVPLPIPLILAWPLVGLALGVAALIEAVWGRSHRGGSPVFTKAALLALCELHGLQVDFRGARGGRMFLWML